MRGDKHRTDRGCSPDLDSEWLPDGDEPSGERERMLPLESLGFGAIACVALWGFGLLGMLGILAAIPLLMGFMLYYQQDGLLYCAYRCSDYSRTPASLPPMQNFEALQLHCLDATRISCWFIKQPRHSQRPTLIFFHGNAGCMEGRLENAHGLFVNAGCNVLMVDYRGYGTSDGKPDEDGLRLDAQAALDHLHSRPDVDRLFPPLSLRSPSPCINSQGCDARAC
jgi:hypothetical protein